MITPEDEHPNMLELARESYRKKDNPVTNIDVKALKGRLDTEICRVEKVRGEMQVLFGEDKNIVASQLEKLLKDLRTALDLIPGEVDVDGFLNEARRGQIEVGSGAVDWAIPEKKVRQLIQSLPGKVDGPDSVVVPSNIVCVQWGSIEYKEILVTAEDGTQGVYWPDDAVYPLLKAMITAQDNEGEG